MNEEKRKAIGLFRYAIIAPIISGIFDEHSSLKGFFRDAAKKFYTLPNGKEVQVSESTIERWYYQYQKNGFDVLLPKQRQDIGFSRKLDEDMIEQIKYLKEAYPKLPATLIYQMLIDNGTIRKKEVSLSTINRYINHLNLEKGTTSNEDIRRYERPHINEVWYGDSSVGPYLKINGKKKKVWIQAFIDDASRYIVGIDIFFNDNYINLMSVLKSAITKFGRPKILSFDNGSAYKNKQMSLLVARIGVSLNYCAPYTPIQKAKIERWFRTLKQQWMSTLNMNDFKDLDDLRTSLNTYVQHYNQRVHSSLGGLSPQERFFNESKFIKRLSEAEIDKCFLLEFERRVSPDNVIVIDGVEYEVDYRYSKQRITLRYTPDLSQVFVVDPARDTLTPIKLLNKHDNSKIKRTKVKLTGGVE